MVTELNYDYSKLRGRIIEYYGSLQAFAKAIKLSEHTVSKYMNNKIPWKQSNITSAVNVLEIQPERICEYFFTLTVKPAEHSGIGEKSDCLEVKS